jgi:Protein of unknown function (DUF3102)
VARALRVVEAQPVPSTADYVCRIQALVRATVENIIQIGRVLNEAKAALPHGEFTTMVEMELPFTARTAQRYMAVAAHPVLGNTTHASYLPASWTTLYELTTVPVPTLEIMLKKGIITPSMQRKDVAVFRPLPDQCPPTTKVDSEPARWSGVAGPLGPPCNGMRFAEMAVMDLEQIRPDDEQRARAFAFVQEWLDAVRAKS